MCIRDRARVGLAEELVHGLRDGHATERDLVVVPPERGFERCLVLRRENDDRWVAATICLYSSSSCFLVAARLASASCASSTLVLLGAPLSAAKTLPADGLLVK